MAHHWVVSPCSFLHRSPLIVPLTFGWETWSRLGSEHLNLRLNVNGASSRSEYGRVEASRRFRSWKSALGVGLSTCQWDKVL